MRKIGTQMKELDGNQKLSQTPEVVSYGTFNVSSKSKSDKKETKSQVKIPITYVVIPRFGMNLEKFFELKKNRLSKQFVYNLGL